ncbi:MAG TPA: S8 family serine peptidase [Thermoanaerobaculia bacterium]
MNRIGSKLAIVTLSLILATSAIAAPGGQGKFRTSERGIPDRYIVVFNDGVADVRGAMNDMAASHAAVPGHVYSSALKGFSARMSEGMAKRLSNDPRVAWVEQDAIIQLEATQTNATWGLDRIDQRNLPLNGSYTYDTTASNVNAYIVDTGIRRGHTDFGGRAVTGFDAITSGGTGEDCNGHGTHVAGTVGGSTWGVAKGVKLYAVRVLDCNGSGTTAGVIAGVDWVTANHIKPAVANMSLGGGASSSLDQAVQNSINAGVGYVVAAGNGDFRGRQQDACNSSPARVAAAMTVSASNSSDAKASWANYGNCVDFFAPGVSITSAWHSSNTATNTISGTSMAAPHVAGAAALYLAGNTGATPLQVRDAIYANTTKNKVTSSSTTNNHLLYTTGLFAGGGGGEPPPPNVAPTANFTYATSGLTVNFTDTSTDSDGSISSRSWNFGDGTTSTATNPSKTYAAGGTYTVGLTVTDNGGATGSTSQSVTVTAPPSGGGISLSVNGYKNKGDKYADLTWSGATGTNVDVYRGTTKFSTANNGAYTDGPNGKGGGSITYKVCQTNSTTVCSASVTVNY